MDPRLLADIYHANRDTWLTERSDINTIKDRVGVINIFRNMPEEKQFFVSVTDAIILMKEQRDAKERKKELSGIKPCKINKKQHT
jgi:hypothetical protein